MTRKEARRTAFCLLFESGFKADEKAVEIYDISSDNREIENDLYVREVFFGVLENLEEIDALIGKHSHGWKPDRISRVSKTILRIAVYEMTKMSNIPSVVSINEALEICKEYDEEKARPFVNGVLNSVKDDFKKDQEITNDEE